MASIECSNYLAIDFLNTHKIFEMFCYSFALSCHFSFRFGLRYDGRGSIKKLVSVVLEKQSSNHTRGGGVQIFFLKNVNLA